MKITRAIVTSAATVAVLATVAIAGSPERETTSNVKEQPRCSTKAEERNLRRLEERLDLLAAGDFTAEQSYFDENATVVVHGSVSYAGTYRVKDGSYGQVMQATWSIGGDAPEPSLYADCDKVILIGPFDATARATGTAVDSPVVEVFTYTKDGKILRDDFYFTDTAVIHAALGA